MAQQTGSDDNSILAPKGPLVRAILASMPDALAIYCFGSKVMGSAHDESDLDLAVLLPGYADPASLWKLSEVLVPIAGCEVDLVDMRAASTVMQYQVLMNGRRLLAKQPEADLFECFVLSEKTALDEARAGLLKDIGKRGRIYG
jgi:predicted nucleotidyltransferase